MMLKHALLVCLLVSAPANASVWDRALTSEEDEAAQELYDAKMVEGDTAALSASVQSTSIKTTLDSVNRAERAYRAAAEIRPREAEPYFRIGSLLYQMYFDCDPHNLRPSTCDQVYATPHRSELVIEAWDEFERRAPLDPRVAEILRPRALLNTKLVSGGPDDPKHLAGAARDYEAILSRADGLSGNGADDFSLGNLAETYMMLGRLDEAIATYNRAIAVGAARVSTIYGLAVALDRDGSGDRAAQYILDQTAGGYASFKAEYQAGGVFFVPDGEVFYYFALIDEAFGNYGAALEYWNRYIASGAHPQFQPRAREHIELLHKRRVRPQPPSDLDELNWQN